MGANQQSNQKLKIHFIIQKQVDFGKALYVVGNISQLGAWTVQKSLKLSWFKDHYWTSFITLSSNQLIQPIQFKYVIGNWDNPQEGALEWEAGKNNRYISGPLDTYHIVCQNTWNMQKITLNLIVPDEGKNVEYSVIGDCKQLGNWKKTYQMKRNDKKVLPILQNLNREKKYASYSLSFKVFRGKPKIHYYYIKKDQGTEIQRHPGRKYQTESRQNSHPKCLKIENNRGDTEMFQICNFKELNYSKITQNILLGAYLSTPEDFKILKNEGVSSILSIQTHQDLAMHCLTEGYLRQQSQNSGIKLETYAIQDMNKKDFLQKCKGAIEILKKLIDKNKKVYVHCSAGVYRSPQLVALYLILTQNYSPEQAVEHVKLRHPFARPNRKIVLNAVSQLLNQNMNKKGT